MSCSIPSCRKHERDDSDDEDGSDRVRRMSGDEGDNETAQRERRRRFHKLSIFDPPPSRFTLLRGKILKSIKTLYAYWLKLRNDRYQWALFKTILWFAIGLKLFHDLARHAKVSLLLGGGQSKCPKIDETRRRDACANLPKIDPCAKPSQKDPCAKPPQIDPCAKPPQIDPLCAKPPQIDPCGNPPQIGPCDKSCENCACPQSDKSAQTLQSEEDKKMAEQCRGRWLYKI